MSSPLRTTDVADATGYSVQQVRDLERLGVIPPAGRSANGYRHYLPVHVQAVRAYRGLTAAVGPVVARRTMTALWDASPADAVAAVTELHVRLATERARTLQALSALHEIRDTSEPTGPGEVLSITELADALGVRTSTLRHWEAEELVDPERIGSLRVRTYGPGATRDARIVAALRSAGHGIPALRRIVDSLRELGGDAEAEDALRRRLDEIAERSVALLRAGSDLAAVLEELRSSHDEGPPRTDP